MISGLIISISVAVIVAIIAGTFYLVAARFAGRPSALYYAEQEVKRLQAQCLEFEKQVREYTAKIAVLERRTNIETALDPLRELMKEHETNAKDRSDAILNILDAIARQLGDEREPTASAQP